VALTPACWSSSISASGVGSHRTRGPLRQAQIRYSLPCRVPGNRWTICPVRTPHLCCECEARKAGLLAELARQWNAPVSPKESRRVSLRRLAPADPRLRLRTQQRGCHACSPAHDLVPALFCIQLSAGRRPW
jgi:hypothetical protein